MISLCFYFRFKFDFNINFKIFLNTRNCHINIMYKMTCIYSNMYMIYGVGYMIWFVLKINIYNIQMIYFEY